MTAITLFSRGNTLAYSGSSVASSFRTSSSSSTTQSWTSGCTASKANAYDSVIDVDSSQPTVKIKILPLSSISESLDFDTRFSVLTSSLALISVLMSVAALDCPLATFDRSFTTVSSMYCRNSRMASNNLLVLVGSSDSSTGSLKSGMMPSIAGEIEVLITVTSASRSDSV